MRILLIMDPGIQVPPPLYGGHERLVYMFAEEYKKMGHEVSLLAGPGSYCGGTVFTFGINDLARSKFQKQKELFQAWKFLWQRRHDFDLVHNFGRLLYLLPLLNYPVKKIMSYGRAVSAKGIRAIASLPNKNLIFTACSNNCVSTGNVAGTWQTVYNAIDFSKYELQEQVAEDAPLMFLGRLDKIKGVHTAIEVAIATGNKLWIGGNIPTTADNYQYYKTQLEPKFDNNQIMYLGALNDEQKNHYLGRAKALLFPIEWAEPFGMVMVEAMACGTPVIGFDQGSVPEVIDDGITGFRTRDSQEMIQAVNKLSMIDRQKCREWSKKCFDLPVIAQDYLSLFH